MKIAPTITINNQLYFGITDAATCIGISVHSLRRETDRRRIRFLRHPKGIMFLPEWLEEWVQRRTVEPRKKG